MDESREHPGSLEPKDISAAGRVLNSRITAVVLLAALLVLFFNRLGAYGVWDPWEPLYAEGAYEMKESGNWLIPTYQNEPRLSKPILTYWGIAAGTSLLGENEWGIRLLSTLVSFAAVLIVWAAFSGLRGRRCGLLTALVVSASPFYYLLARRAVPDTYLLAGMTIAASCLTRAHFGPPPAGRWYLLGYVGIAVAVLGKGPLGLLIPAMAIVFYGLYELDIGKVKAQGNLARLLGSLLTLCSSLVLAGLGVFLLWSERISARVPFQPLFLAIHAWADARRLLPVLLSLAWLGSVLMAALSLRALYRLSRLEENRDLQKGLFFLVRQTAICLGVVFALAGPWYVAVYFTEGREFVNSFLIHRHLESFASEVRNSGKIELYAKALLLGFLPWFALLPAALLRAFSPGKPEEEKRKRPEIFLAGWGLLTVFLFALAVTQFYHYVAPAVPPLAMLLALTLDRWLNGERSPALRPLLLLAILLLIPPVHDLLTLNFRHVLRLVSPQHYITSAIQKPMLPWTAVCFGLFFIGLLAALHSRWRGIGLTLGCAAALVFGIAMTNRFMVDVGRFKSPKALMETYRRIAGEGTAYSFAQIAAPVVYYARNRVEFFDLSTSELLRRAREHSPLYCVVPNSRIPTLAKKLAREHSRLRVMDNTTYYRLSIIEVVVRPAGEEAATGRRDESKEEQAGQEPQDEP
jgi:4-amino-4-deoxy-L-arabinose transferase-like glycosyltransferase